MQDNPEHGSTMVASHSPRVVALAGRDAVAFAQAQFMNDVSALADGDWHWNGWLTPKGRVIALFALVRLDGETVWLVVPDADAGELVQRLQRFVFRSKVALTLREDLRVAGGLTAPARARGGRIARLDDGEIELDLGGAGGPRRWRVSADATGDDVSGAAWALADIAHGLPRLPPSQAEHWTPQQLSLDRLRAFSVRKGCYPGQEIVARTHFLGQAKRGLALFDADAPLRAGREIREDGTVWGTVVSAVSADGTHRALAVGSLDRVPGLAHCEGIGVRVQPLFDGLAR